MLDLNEMLRETDDDTDDGLDRGFDRGSDELATESTVTAHVRMRPFADGPDDDLGIDINRIMDGVIKGAAGAARQAGQVAGQAVNTGASVLNAAIREAGGVAKEATREGGEVIKAALGDVGGAPVHGAGPVPKPPPGAYGVPLSEVLAGATRKGRSTYDLADTVGPGPVIPVATLQRCSIELDVPESECVEMDRARSLLLLFGLVVGGILILRGIFSGRGNKGPTFPS